VHERRALARATSTGSSTTSPSQSGRAPPTRRGAVLGHDDEGDQRHNARLLDPGVQGRRSYWPTEMIDALTPYSGGEHPALAHGWAEWQKTRAKARAAAFLVAQELVDLYRQRNVAVGHAFAPTRMAARDEDLFPFTLTADQAQAIED